MEEIDSFEQCLTSLKEKGDGLVSHCSEQVQAKLSQQIQAHQQGIKDSYSAICSTAQRVSNLFAFCFTHFLVFHRFASNEILICLNQLTELCTYVIMTVALLLTLKVKYLHIVYKSRHT